MVQVFPAQRTTKSQGHFRSFWVGGVGRAYSPEIHLSPEQALESLINAHLEEKREQFHKEEPDYHVTITIKRRTHLQQRASEAEFISV
jgi:hypothetical protein